MGGLIDDADEHLGLSIGETGKAPRDCRVQILCAWMIEIPQEAVSLIDDVGLKTIDVAGLEIP